MNLTDLMGGKERNQNTGKEENDKEEAEKRKEKERQGPQAFSFWHGRIIDLDKASS